jgi:tRNA(adenine34) deaminase
MAGMACHFLLNAMLGAVPSRSVCRPRMPRAARVICSSAAAIDTLDEAYMRLALAEAAAAGEAGEVPIGAVLRMGDAVLASGRNSVEQLRDASAHAEMLCLRAAAAVAGNWRLNLRPSTLYVTVEPCPMCLAAIYAFRVGRLVYATENTRLGAVTGAMRIPTDHPFHTLQVDSGILRPEAAALMQEFFRRRRIQASSMCQKEHSFGEVAQHMGEMGPKKESD